MAEHLYARIPRLSPEGVVQGITLQALVPTQPALRLDHFEWIGRGHEYVRNQRIGVECYWRHHLRQLFFLEPFGLSRLLGLLGTNSGRQHEHGYHGPRHRSVDNFRRFHGISFLALSKKTSRIPARDVREVFSGSQTLIIYFQYTT